MEGHIQHWLLSCKSLYIFPPGRVSKSMVLRRGIDALGRQPEEFCLSECEGAKMRVGWILSCIPELM